MTHTADARHIFVAHLLLVLPHMRIDRQCSLKLIQRWTVLLFAEAPNSFLLVEFVTNYHAQGLKD